jgi:hypothetical protein
LKPSVCNECFQREETCSGPKTAFERRCIKSFSTKGKKIALDILRNALQQCKDENELLEQLERFYHKIKPTTQNDQLPLVSPLESDPNPRFSRSPQTLQYTDNISNNSLGQYSPPSTISPLFHAGDLIVEHPPSTQSAQTMEARVEVSPILPQTSNRVLFAMRDLDESHRVRSGFASDERFQSLASPVDQFARTDVNYNLFDLSSEFDDGYPHSYEASDWFFSSG